MSATKIELLDAILTGGYDQGCFLRPVGSDLLSGGDPSAMDAVLAALVERDLLPSATVAGPYEHEPLATRAMKTRGPALSS